MHFHHSQLDHHGPTDQQTNQWTDKASYRDAWTHLKTARILDDKRHCDQGKKGGRLTKGSEGGGRGVGGGGGEEESRALHWECWFFIEFHVDINRFLLCCLHQTINPSYSNVVDFQVKMTNNIFF